jgi:hypothetical protein
LKSKPLSLVSDMRRMPLGELFLGDRTLIPSWWRSVCLGHSFSHQTDVFGTTKHSVNVVYMATFREERKGIYLFSWCWSLTLNPMLHSVRESDPRHGLLVYSPSRKKNAILVFLKQISGVTDRVDKTGGNWSSSAGSR